MPRPNVERSKPRVTSMYRERRQELVSMVFSLSPCSVPPGTGDPDLGVTCVGLESEAKPHSVIPSAPHEEEQITPDDAREMHCHP